MKNIKFTIFLLLLSLFSATICRAAFPANAAPVATHATVAVNNTHEHGHFLSGLKSMWTHGKAKLDQIVYVILAIFPLGWLGMGINDNFEGIDWVISLILYLLGWLPGVIYTLYKMSKYY